MSREVVLVPGLWMPAASMGLLAARLARRGFDAHAFPHHGREAMPGNIERLARHARARGNRPLHYVGHSLGGVLILETLARHRDLPVASVVLLGAPAGGSLVGRRFAGLGLARWMMGAARERWAAGEARWARPEPLGVVAGTLSFGVGRLLGGVGGANDGVVRVEETAVAGMADTARVAVSHSMLIASARVAQLVARFLDTGRFA